MQIRAMHMDAWGRIILEEDGGKFRESVIAHENEFRWSRRVSSPASCSDDDIESRHRFDPWNWVEKGMRLGFRLLV